MKAIHHSIIKHTGFTVFAILLMQSQASYAYKLGDIISQSDTVEAERIEYHKGTGGSSDFINVTGCKQCPLRLPINADTKFLYQGKPINKQRIPFISGKPGTVIYYSKDQRVVRVRWY